MSKCFVILFFLVGFQWASGQQDGPFEEYYDNGQLKVQGHYKNEKPVGTWQKYHPNGQLSGVYSYSDGKLDQEKTYYFDNGNINWEIKEVDGKYIGKGYYESGNLFYERIVSNGYYKEYFESGTLAIEANYVENELVGAWKKFYPSGELEWVVQYKSGYREGGYQNFYKNGQLKLEGTMHKDKKHGEERRYLEDGQLEWTGKYREDQFDKNWQRFDASGKVVQKIKFANGLTPTRNYADYLTRTIVPEGLLEKLPVYPGCEKEFSNSGRKKCMNTEISQFIMSRYTVPTGIELNGKYRIRVKFEIRKDGQIGDIEVTADPDSPALVVEALRILYALPKIQPGQQFGKPVVVPYSIPITLAIQ